MTIRIQNENTDHQVVTVGIWAKSSTDIDQDIYNFILVLSDKCQDVPSAWDWEKIGLFYDLYFCFTPCTCQGRGASTKRILTVNSYCFRALH
jgi:hypothetical protein